MGLLGELLFFSVTCHNQPGADETKCHSPLTQRNSFPQSSQEEGCELSASGLLDQFQMLLVTLR